MKNIADVLREKEAEIARLESEIEALNVAIRLCSEDSEGFEPSKHDATTSSKPVRAASFQEPQKTMKQFP